MKLFRFMAILLLASSLAFSACFNDDDGFDGGGSVGGTQFVVVYHANGGTAGTEPIDSGEYESGDTVTVLDNTGDLRGAVIRDNIKQRFIGWNTDSGETTAEYVADNTFTITEDTTLYAIYTTGYDVIRKVGPAGGWVFYDAGSGSPRYLEAAIKDQSTGIQWSPSDTAVGSIGTALWTGSDNTDMIITDYGVGSYAASVARTYTGGGYSDWSLPSKDELNQMYINLREFGVGDFALAVYWSSSERDDGYKFYQIFNDTGSQSVGSWINPNRVRAVRAF